jgi:hypothetical protein
MGFGRGKTICVNDIIMQILPGSSDDDAQLINVSGEFCNSSRAGARTLAGSRVLRPPPRE